MQLKTRADSLTSQTISFGGRPPSIQWVGGSVGPRDGMNAVLLRILTLELSREKSIKQRTSSKTYFNVVHRHYQEMRRLPMSWFCQCYQKYKRQIVQANLFVNNKSAATCTLTQWWNMILDKKIATQCPKNFPFFFTTFGGFPKHGNKIEKYDESCNKRRWNPRKYEGRDTHTLRVEMKTKQ